MKMELTINIKEDETPFSDEHKTLKRIETGETSFRNWNKIKQNYEKTPI